ncbi:putative protein N(5)-glutamine methyltransferase [Falsibacillus albus]|uniref:peptide chain release factor N(5)-glutamine methyltransferase n=1 Tax=Falsibacillus albus TaxID=2478915 RepID=A0A3L7JSM0_9BACI|nr:putative protein N(5)-glutamine methyltransferase [Falsibacillus albus]RLQ93696.1 putative protein N(5)-glutamine methyltransferase [Falsibacillus albus]
MDVQNGQEIIDKLRSAGCVFAEEEAQLLISEARTMEHLKTMTELRVTGRPIEYVVGATTFCNLRIELEMGVFIPRRRTEFLVQQARALACPGDIVVDLCCGSGAVGAALAAELNRISLYAVDIDPIAVRCAARNVTDKGGQVFQGDLYTPLPQSLKGRVNIIVANTPYVPTEAIEMLPQEARLYEPKVALDGGQDGLDLQRKAAQEAPRWLAPGGHLLIETSERQAPKTFEIFMSAGLTTRIVRNEEMDATVVIGVRPPLEY